MSKLHVKKGDNVVVIAGTQKGKKGTVLSVDVEKQRAIVDGVNLVSKHARPSTENPKGGIVKKEAILMNKRKSMTPSQQCYQKIDENTVPLEDCVKLLREYEDFDIMRGFFDSGIEMLEVFSYMRRYGI